MPDNFQENHPEWLPARQRMPGLLDLRGHFVADVPPNPIFLHRDFHFIQAAYPVTEEHVLLVSPVKAALVHIPRQEVLWTITCPTEGASALHLQYHLLALGSTRGVFVWDLHTGSLLHRLDVDEEQPTGLAFSTDGSLLAVGLYDTGVQVWQVSEGHLLYTLWESDDTDGHRSVTLSPDGQWLASGGHESHVVWVWRLVEGQLAHHLQESAGRVCGLAFSPDGHLLVCGDGSGEGEIQPIRVWEMPEGRAVRRFPWYGINPTFSPDGHLLAAGGRLPTAEQDSQTGMIFVGEVDSRRELQRLTGHAAHVMHLAFSPSGRGLLSCGADRTVRWWDLSSGQEVYRLETLMPY